MRTIWTWLAIGGAILAGYEEARARAEILKARAEQLGRQQ